MENDNLQAPPSGHEQRGSFISRRNMLTTSVAAIAGITAFGNGNLLTPEVKQERERKDIFSLKGKVAIVTGAARGIGRAISVALAESGADVVGVDISGTASKEVVYSAATMTDLHETGRLVQEQQRKFKAVQCDIRDMRAIKSVVEDTLREFGKIDILVADAGIQVYALLHR